MKKLIFLSGTKGGTGKTTLALNSAVLLAYLWRDVAHYPVAFLDLTPNVGTAALYSWEIPSRRGADLLCRTSRGGGSQTP